MVGLWITYKFGVLTPVIGIRSLPAVPHSGMSGVTPSCYQKGGLSSTCDTPFYISGRRCYSTHIPTVRPSPNCI